MTRILEPWDRPYYDWRDPNMKVLGFGFRRDTGASVTFEQEAHERQQHCQRQMQYAPVAHWSEDPSYSWRKK